MVFEHDKIMVVPCRRMPFYYELKILFVLWMLSPMTRGSSFMFKKFVHPQLARREKVRIPGECYCSHHTSNS